MSRSYETLGSAVIYCWINIYYDHNQHGLIGQRSLPLSLHGLIGERSCHYIPFLQCILKLWLYHQQRQDVSPASSQCWPVYQIMYDV